MNHKIKGNALLCVFIEIFSDNIVKAVIELCFENVINKAINNFSYVAMDKTLVKKSDY